VKRTQQAMGIESRLADRQLADNPIYGDQTLGDGIDCEEKTFESNGAEQWRTGGRDEARSRNFIAVQSQPRFGYGPCVSLSVRDHDALRACGLELEPFRQRSGHHAKSNAGVHKKLNFFDTSGRAGKMSLYVEQSHLEYLLKNMVIVAQPTNNATTLNSQERRRGNSEQNKFNVGSQLHISESRGRIK
jgi:hypothetical protein